MINSNIIIRGTLIVVIPTDDGIVIASDSRSSSEWNKKVFWDNADKIKFIPGNLEIAFTLTGLDKLYAPQPDSITDLNEWQEKGTAIWNGKKIIGDFLMSYDVNQINDELMKEVGNVLTSSLENLIKTNNKELEHYKGKEVGQFVIIRYDPKLGRSTIATLKVKRKPQGDFVSEDISIQSFSQRNKRTMDIYGEGEYALKYVINDNSRRFLNEDFYKLWNSITYIEEMTLENATILATLLIDATSSATDIIPTQSGITIGGKVQVFFINGLEPPIRKSSGE